MNVDQVRWLFAYDQWATRRVLAVLHGLDNASWAEPNLVGDRGLGGILVHQLGAAQRWRHAFQETGQEPAPEREPLPSISELMQRWEEEWAAVDAWLKEVTQGFIDHVVDGVPVWQMLMHLVNHGTQHRSEAAALLTAKGRSPGELDLINYAEALAAGREP
jgi:uncharacterized damage-inducible protein DinB